MDKTELIKQIMEASDKKDIVFFDKVSDAPKEKLEILKKLQQYEAGKRTT